MDLDFELKLQCVVLGVAETAKLFGLPEEADSRVVMAPEGDTILISVVDTDIDNLGELFTVTIGPDELAPIGGLQGNYYFSELASIIPEEFFAAFLDYLEYKQKVDAATDTSGSSEEDPVNNPSHYTSHPSGVEHIEISRHMTFNAGNVIKYLWRNGLKDGSPAVQDLEKAAWYLNDEINKIKGENKWKNTIPRLLQHLRKGN